MKVLQVIDRLMRGGGAEKFALDLTIALHKIEGVQIDVLSIVAPDNDDFVEILKENGIRHSVLSDNLRSPSNIIRLKRFIKAGDYDVVHVHLFPALYYASMARFLSKNRFGLVYTEHSTTNRRRNNVMLRIVDRFIYKRYDVIIGISDKVKENLDRHLGVNFVRVINNGININSIQNALTSNIRADENISSDAIVITMVSRIAEGKDYATLINAIERLPERFHVVFVGGGPLMPNLKSCADNSDAAARIHILGLRSDVFGILKASDIIVLSTHHEGFSIAMLEAMASKKPFVASAVEGVKDLVGGIAELFEYQNSDELSSILLALYNDKNRYSCVADRCYEFAKKYDIGNVAKQYLDIYQELI